MLQRGRALHARIARELERPPFTDTVASTGPRAFTRGLECVEGVHPPDDASFNGAARFHARIELDAVSLLQRLERASTGPRAFTRGLNILRSSFLTINRSFNGAARFHARIVYS